ncbi:threonine--tRNA ligase [Jatrophihabitans lederbergiae]|uniref:Threonine--tRNA ligase n=1 Tax=Jatrophihabitans lederbergiae TaxID=3075547 RepID=A0ABU2JBU3_9ACTN|nr:threonine--tRNA ligase [Jatrophihabitans sp. DSM 44399]MDT0262458.1 threonine--tRNA ligase [Jatrophihabitans sp. DSM 44399]
MTSSDDQLKRIRHSSAHVLAQAVRERFGPEGHVALAIGPPTARGFYYDFSLPRPVVEGDLKWLEKRMKKILRGNHDFVQRDVSEDEARSLFADQPFKLEIIDGIVHGGVDAHGEPFEGEPVLGTYQQDTFLDLCGGPHIANTRDIDPNAVKLLTVAGAYWRGDESRPMLQRIYGTAWGTREELDHFLFLRAEAERRDHRKVGRELDLFMFDKSAPGMPYWLPDGLRMLNTMLEFWRNEHEARGYQEISSPLINEKSLWETSGHWQNYVDDMFVIPDGDNRTYAVKPMNCPNAMVVYNRKTTSYRELPLRLSDCDLLHRNERSGTLQGLLRVQAFRQDDAHIFLPEAEIGAEIQRIFDIADRFYGVFGLKYRLRLGTRPEKFIGDVATWDLAESTLRDVLEERAPGEYIVVEGDGAFYGPKIDILMEDALEREWQMGTIQLDFQLPRRFGCVYTDDQGQEVTPVVIHRVIYGSLERFVGILLEHTAGALAPWLAPRQAIVLPVAVDYEAAAEALREELVAAGLRADLWSATTGTLGARARRARMAKYPFVLVVGAQEAEGSELSVKLREGGQVPPLTRAEVVERMVRSVRQFDNSTETAFADVLPAEAPAAAEAGATSS